MQVDIVLFVLSFSLLRPIATSVFALNLLTGMLHLGPLEGMSTTQLQRTFDTNVFGVQRVCKAFLPLLRLSACASKASSSVSSDSASIKFRPRIINISSVASYARAGHQSVYGASKAALVLFSDS
jgi:NAD(P)-dependent dehydrogenase (short-subunit alcohol dehydrogenase family)